LPLFTAAAFGTASQLMPSFSPVADAKQKFDRQHMHVATLKEN